MRSRRTLTNNRKRTTKSRRQVVQADDHLSARIIYADDHPDAGWFRSDRSDARFFWTQDRGNGDQIGPGHGTNYFGRPGIFARRHGSLAGRTERAGIYPDERRCLPRSGRGRLRSGHCRIGAPRRSAFCVQRSHSAGEAGPQVRILQQREGWLDALVLVSAEILRLGQALVRAHRAEQAKKSLEQQATLGRYMLDVRHTLNNSLTSVLGNSELLVLDPGSLSAAERSQIETIRNMAVRMHEILRRFSSIEKELNAVEKQAENEARTRSRAATATS